MNPYIVFAILLLVSVWYLQETAPPSIVAENKSIVSDVVGNDNNGTLIDKIDGFLRSIEGTTKSALEDTGYEPFHILFYLLLIFGVIVLLQTLFSRGGNVFSNVLLWIIIIIAILLFAGVI